MPSNKILRVRNCIHITASYFHLTLVSKSVSQKILGLKLIKLDCIFIHLNLKLEISWMEPVACLFCCSLKLSNFLLSNTSLLVYLNWKGRQTDVFNACKWNLKV